ncbi:MAG: hypothetical protein M3Q83_05000 [Pseudomonadota bacterium]|nr:hypothetical protein [Pseudomonadota bacterium]
MTRTMVAALLIAVSVAACQAVGPVAANDSLDLIARDYVLLSLTIGEKEEGYIDAYYGPPELQAKAKADAPGQSVDQLAGRASALKVRAALFSAEPGDALDARRAAFLIAQLTAAETRLRMLRGEKLAFGEEALGLFGVLPELAPLASFDPVLARIDKLVPGEGPLATRVDAFQDRFTIPKDRLKPVFDAAIAECKRRTQAHIQLPPNERFTMAFVTGKSWSGYNYYQGKAISRIEINTDLPIRISRAVDLGCHEGYPGHHVLNAMLEQRLVKDKGWVEYSVYPLYSPQSLIAEGSANYGIDLAFPGPERLAYETSALYPLAGLPTADAAGYSALQEAMEDLGGARFTIARELLEGRIDDAEAIRLTQRYQLVSPERAKQSIDFTKQYRSYVINYGLGQDMVRADVEAAGATPAARWKRMEEIISEPTLPSDLRS